jgi:iron complex outermembrane receptor protein
MPRLWAGAATAILLAFNPGAAPAQTTPGGAKPLESLPEIEVIAAGPLAASGIDRDKVPAPAWSLDSGELRLEGPASLTGTLERLVPGVAVNDVTGSPFQPDLQFRGFAASPVLGTPAGLAVYQNGARINEAFGDTVNWNLVPDFAVRRADLLTADPVFGLNALGGALALEMKNGFNFQESRLELAGGSFGRGDATFEAGVQSGAIASYIGGHLATDGGYRQHSSAAIGQVYGDLGAETDRVNLHLSFTGSTDAIHAVGPAPVELLAGDPSAAFTVPQGSRNQLAFVTATAKAKATDTLAIDALFYFRRFEQRAVDGNTTEARRCDSAFAPGLLCLSSPTTPLFSTGGTQIADIPGANLGEVDHSATAASGLGGSLQATERMQVAGHDNHLVLGASIDHADVGFSAASELALLRPELAAIGTGIVINQPDGSIVPVRLNTTSTYIGLYARDTYNLTPRLAITAGGRFNLATIQLDDRNGTALNGAHSYARFNPAAGVTYRILAPVTAYAGYAETNRVPTPGELACADPARPCALNTFLVADPGLKQVVARTIEAGLRGSAAVGAGDGSEGKLDWKLGAFMIRDRDDILNVQSPITNFGFFTNIGGTRRRGIEAGIGFKSEGWDLHADYELLDATFQSALTLRSLNNPAADQNGQIQVRPGDRIPALPQHQFKAGIDRALTPRWHLGADLVVASSQFLRGDESNSNKPLPGYWVVDLHSRYKVSDNAEVFLLIRNLFDRKYDTFGTFFAPDQVGFLGLNNPRSVSPAPPLAILAGVRAVF